MPIIIKKKVSLDFLGDEYKEAYLTFKSIPAVDFDEVLAKLKTLEDKKEGALTFLLDILKQYFIEGEFPDDDNKLTGVAKEDLDGLDATTVLEAFGKFTGQELDPKAGTPLTNTSTMADIPPENS